MIMADVWKILFLVLGTQAVMVSYWLLAAALFPQALRRTRAAYDARSGRLTLVGVLVTLPLLFIGTALLQQGPNPLLKLLGALLLSTPVALGLAGSAGLCERIGAGLPGDADDRLPWRRVLPRPVLRPLALQLERLVEHRRRRPPGLGRPLLINTITKSVVVSFLIFSC